MFSYKIPKYFENTFLENTCVQWLLKVPLKKITSQLLEILSKIVFLHVKLAIMCIQSSKKETFHKQPVGFLFKNNCSVRHMFCTIFVSLSVAKILEKYVKSSSYLEGKFTLTWKIYWTAICISVPWHKFFLTDIFKNSYLYLVKEKSTKFINEN